MVKEIIVFSDIEMGAGNLTDDFIADKTLAMLVKTFGEKSHAVDLVFNGDTFDFLKCPYKLAPQPAYTRHVTSEAAVAKLKLVHRAHPLVFDAMRAFASQKDKKIYFVRGNHDLEIAFPEVQKELKKLIGNTVEFPGLFYKRSRVYVEHGQQYDIANFINPQETFTRHNGKTILNNTFASFAVISALIPLKEQHPFLERIKPWPVMLRLYAPIGKKVNRTIATYFLKSLFYYPLRYYDDPTHIFPRKMIGEFIRRIRQWNWEVDDYLSIFKKEKKLNEVIVLGHIHEKYLERGRNHVIIRPGTWRDEYYLDAATGLVQPAKKRYVDILLGDVIQWKLVTMPHRRKPFHFYDVVKDEKKYLEWAKKAEWIK